MNDFGATRVVQVTNIAPQATRDQMHTLFSHLGKIEDLRLYPSMRDASVSIQSRVCFIKFLDEQTLPVSLHMTNTVFIDRAIIVQPFTNGDIPDEISGLEFANASSLNRGEARLPPHVTTEKNSDGLHETVDENLSRTGLPPFPLLPGELELKVVEEVRRTVVVMGLQSSVASSEIMEYFTQGAGEVKYFRWCNNKPELLKEGEENTRTALLEFSDYGAILPAMKLNNTVLPSGSAVRVYYSSQPITKPQAKSNEAALKEIEEAMKKVKEAQNLVTAAVDPLMGMLGVKGKSSRSRSRTPSRGRDYYDRDRYSSRRRSRSRSRRRSRSRSRRRSRDRRRSRSRRRTRSRDRKKRSRSRRRSRSRSREKRKEKERKKEEEKVKKEEVKEAEPSATEETNGTATEANGADNGTKEVEVKKEKEGSSKKKSRSKSRERKRSRSRDRKKSRSRSRKRSKRSRSRDRRRRSRSRDRKRSRSRSRDRRRSRSRDHKSKKSKKDRKSSRDRDSKKEKEPITRDYDQEEAGYENPPKKEEKLEAVDMEISNSP